MSLNNNRNHKTGKLSLEAVSRQKKALELRIAGHNYDHIAAEVGYTNRSAAFKAVMAALKRTLQEPADEVRRIENERIDVLWNAIYEKAKAGNFDAIDRAMKLMDRRAKLLGLDAPAKADVTSGGASLAPKVVRVIQPPGCEAAEDRDVRLTAWEADGRN